MNQNITLSLDRDLLKKIKIVASKKEMSISQLVREQFKRLILEDDGFHRLKKKAFKNLDKGLKLGGGPYYNSREEIHAR
jgi:hypothetical protein